jgi:isopenicillin N synthase-like dioxygenase
MVCCPFISLVTYQTYLKYSDTDYFVSALHRVSVPDPDVVSEPGIPARYSVPFFVAPDFSHTVETLPRFITSDNPGKYEPVRFDQYGSIVSKYQYQDNEL